MENNYSYMKGGAIWIFLSGFYLTQLTPISPVYFGFLFFSLFVAVRCFYKNRLYFNFSLVIIMPLVCYLLFGFFQPDANFSIIANFIISLLSAFVTCNLFKGKLVDSRWVLFSFFLFAVLFNFDGLWRIFHPELENLDTLVRLGVGFQVYKYNSIMYSDSNFVGLQNVFLLTSFIYLVFEKKLFMSFRRKESLSIIFLMIISLIITFSRAAILGFFVFLIFLFFKKRVKLRLFFWWLSPILLMTASVFLFYHYSDDVSFRSKFLIINLTYDYLRLASFSDVFFGVGLGNAVEYIGMGAHSLFLTLIIELGALGLLLFFLYISYLFFVFKYDFNLIVLPFLITSLSLGSTAIPYFFVITSLLLLVKNGKVDFY